MIYPASGVSSADTSRLSPRPSPRGSRRASPRASPRTSPRASPPPQQRQLFLQTDSHQQHSYSPTPSSSTTPAQLPLGPGPTEAYQSSHTTHPLPKSNQRYDNNIMPVAIGFRTPQSETTQQPQPNDIENDTVLAIVTDTKINAPTNNTAPVLSTTMSTSKKADVLTRSSTASPPLHSSSSPPLPSSHPSSSPSRSPTFGRSPPLKASKFQGLRPHTSPLVNPGDSNSNTIASGLYRPFTSHHHKHRNDIDADLKVSHKQFETMTARNSFNVSHHLPLEEIMPVSQPTAVQVGIGMVGDSNKTGLERAVLHHRTFQDSATKQLQKIGREKPWDPSNDSYLNYGGWGHAAAVLPPNKVGKDAKFLAPWARFSSSAIADAMKQGYAENTIQPNKGNYTARSFLSTSQS